MVAHSAARPPVVGFSTNVVDTSLHGGRLDGIGVYTKALLRALQSMGVQTYRVGAPIVSSHGFARPEQADVRLPLPVVPTIAWSALTGFSSPFWRRVERAIDLYHATDNRVPSLRRTPVVATIYDAIPLMRPDWASPRLRALKNWLLRSSARNADLAIAISAAAAHEIEMHYGMPHDRIRVVHLGVDDDWFEPPTEQARQALDGIAQLRPGYFLFVGTLQPRKNLRSLLDAYDRLPSAIRSEHQLVIAGKYGWGVEELRRELEGRRVDGRVLWLDYVEHGTLRALYAGATAFVFPSLAEGFGLPLLEALASGLPVIASDIPVLREVAGNCVALTAPNDADALSAAMSSAVSADRSDAARRGRQQHARRFDWNRCAERTYQVYRELV